MYKIDRELLKFKAAKKGYTLKRLATEIDLSGQALLNRLGGKVALTLADVQKIAERLELTQAEIMEIFFSTEQA